MIKAVKSEKLKVKSVVRFHYCGLPFTSYIESEKISDFRSSDFRRVGTCPPNSEIRNKTPLLTPFVLVGGCPPYRFFAHGFLLFTFYSLLFTLLRGVQA